MNAQEIAKALTQLQSDLMDRTGKKPFLDLSLNIRQSGRAIISLYRDYNGGEYDLGKASADSIEAAFEQAFEMVAALPTPEEAAQRTYLKKVADAIDYGHEYALDDQYINPLRSVTKAMTDNLLTDQTAGETT